MTDWQRLQQRLPLLDERRLEQLEGELGAEVLRRLLGLFIEDGRIQGEALAAAFAEQDLERMARHLHSLKSACGSYGALRCQYLGEKLEQCCRRRQREPLAELMFAWQAALADTLAQVRLHR
ncbi:Hpt domain-containing protein [Zobellella taiwanensis]|jgi:HPt (histidine-containing phosphotransfer) domain-containing protein|uniref:Hpt domain-containing protein n=1 Tax=Zobellella taiwanensis TaxID=347535 RepID=A0A2P7QHQ1_9GAMM|nr:Hpt domain-containing protein [Zobellella taiwanensis]PSJ37508.1 Hpt domain-containing protein [Zobellella taiwanensis]